MMKTWTKTSLVLFIIFAFIIPAYSDKPAITYVGGPHGDAMTNILTVFAKEFEEETGIHVEILIVPGGSAYRDRVTAMILSGNAPDILHLVGMETAAFAKFGWLEDLSPYIERDGIDLKSLLIPPVEAAIDWDGSTYIMPLSAQTREIYFNIDHINEMGLSNPIELHNKGAWTWDTMLDMAKRLTEYDETSEIKRAGMYSAATYQNWQWYVWQSGGSLFDRDVFPSRATMNTDEVKSALQFFSDLWTEHRVIPSYAERGRVSGNWFSNGLASMHVVDGPFTISALKARNPGFDWDIVSVPTGPVNNLREVGFNNLQIAKDSKNKDAAWEFVKYVALEVDQIKRLSGATGRPPALLDAIPYYVEHVGSYPTNARQFVDGIFYTRPTLVTPHLNDIYAVVNPILRQVVDGVRAVPDALSEMEQRINALLETK